MAAAPGVRKKQESGQHGKSKVKSVPRASQPPPAKKTNAVDMDPPIPPSVSEHSRDDIRLSFLIHDVSRMRRAAYDQFMKPLGITRAQWWVLAHLSRSDGIMQTQLADVLEVGKASLGDVISGLETGGWVARLSDPADKRAKRVFLTNPAQLLIKQMTDMEVKFNDRVLSELSRSDRTKLYKMLLVIKQSIALLAADRNTDANS